MLVGYARTSTEDQTVGLKDQINMLTKAGTEKIFREQVSSMDKRPELDKCLAFVREGDALIVTKPDRLARSTKQLIDIADDLKARGVGLVVMSMGIDTRNGANPTATLTLTILAAVAQWEREIMLERQRAGIVKAKDEGKFKGRKPLARAKAQHFTSLRSDGMTIRAAAKVAGISEASAYRIMRTEQKAPAEKAAAPKTTGRKSAAR